MKTSLRIVSTATLAVAALGVAPQIADARGGGDVCVSVNGDLKQQRGTASCYSPAEGDDWRYSGDNTRAIAVGNGAWASVDSVGGPGSGSAIAIGAGSTASVFRWTGDTSAKAIGDGATALVGYSANSQAKAIGDGSHVTLYRTSRTTARAIGGCSIQHGDSPDADGQHVSCRGSND